MAELEAADDVADASEGALTRHERNRRVFGRAGSVEYWAAQTELMAVERYVFDRYLRPGMDILDLGVGGGRTVGHLSRFAGRYVGIDYVAEMVDVCRERFPDLEFHEADAADLSRFDDGSFDAVVFAYNGVDFLTPSEKRQRFLAEAHRVLRRGGLLITSRHNPRAVVRLPGQQDGTPVSRLRALVAVPLWAVRRSVRLLPTLAFWRGEGLVVQPPTGFNAPVAPWSRARRRPAGGGAEVYAEMATPRRAREELERAGYDVVAVEGGAYPERLRPLVTSSFYCVALAP